MYTKLYERGIGTGTCTGIIDAEVRERELEIDSLRKQRCMLERELINAHKEIARLQNDARIYRCVDNRAGEGN